MLIFIIYARLGIAGGFAKATPSLKMGNRPTKRAIRMANALVLEQKLHAGAFRSLTDVCDTFGITRMVLSKTLDMLDHTPEEISSILRETY